MIDLEQHSQPKIAIIVPIFNSEQYVRQCLSSLIEQTYRDIEIICIDDCSTDKSLAIIQGFAKKDSRIQIIQNKKNSGPSIARNKGIKNSSAPFIMFCDSDDIFAPTMCEEMFNAIQSSDADLAVSLVKIIYTTKSLMRMIKDKYFFLEKKWSGCYKIDDSMRSTYKNTVVWNKIFKRNILQKHDIFFPENLIYEDNYFCHAYLLWAKKIFFISKPLYYYHRRSNSITGRSFDRKLNTATDNVKVIIEFYHYLIKNELFNKNIIIFWELFLYHTANSINWSNNGVKETYVLTNDFLKNVSFPHPIFLRYLLTSIRNKTFHKAYPKTLFFVYKVKRLLKFIR